MSLTINFLIPVYNAEKYLPRCLDSIYPQIEGTIHEVILVDDGSEDSSGAICDEYKKVYPLNTVVFHKKNEGISPTRNFLLKQATKDYIWFVDADDMIQSDALTKLLDAIKNNDYPEIIAFSYKRFTENGYSKLQNKSVESIYLSGSDYIKENKVNHYLWANLFKTKYISETGTFFCDDLNILEDKIFILTLCCQGANVLITNIYGYNYYIGNPCSTMSNTDKEHRLRNAEYSFQAMLRLNELSEKYKDYSFSGELKKNIAETVSGFLYVFLLCNFDYKLVSDYLNKLLEIKLYPVLKCNNKKAFIFSMFVNIKWLFLSCCRLRNLLNRESVIKPI